MDKFEIIKKIVKVSRSRLKGKTKEEETFTLGISIPKEYLNLLGIKQGELVKATIEKIPQPENHKRSEPNAEVPTSNVPNLQKVD